MTNETYNFDALWNKAQSEPQVQKVAVANKVQIDLTIHDVMDRYVDHAREAVKQNKLSRQTLDELTAQTQNYKTALSKLESAGISTIMDIGKRLGKKISDTMK